jgi:predicted dehydrogenase
MGIKIKWGVLGSGGIARRRTIPEGIAYAKNAVLSSVYDLNSEVNSTVAKEFKTTAAQSVEDLIKADIDAVYIASPANMHMVHALACADGKKHILCEKPLGMTVGEAEKMIEACKQNGVLLGTALMMRFLSQHQVALKLITEGKLGKPVFGRAQLSCWYPPIEDAWRQDPKTGGGGSLMDMGSHCIDLLEMFFGKIESVSCFINNNVHSYKSEDSAIVSLFFENGALGSIDTYFCIPDNSSKNVLELYGSKGSILAKGTIGQGSSGQMRVFLDKEIADYNAQQARNEEDGIVLDPEPVNTYCAEIEEFSNAILEKREPSNNHMLGLRNQIVLSACYESARTGKAIKVG